MKLIDKKELMILGMLHKIVYYTSQSRQDNSMGRSDCKTGIIGLCSDMPKDITEQTLLHEIIHLIDMNLTLGLSEKQVSGLGAGLYSFFKENKL